MTPYHNFTTTIVVGVNSAQFFGKIRINGVNVAWKPFQRFTAQ